MESPLTVAIVVEVDDHDRTGVLGEEEFASAGRRYELYALAGESLLEEAPESSTLVPETHPDLVGYHRAELHLDRVVVGASLSVERSSAA
jgi:hypothetical protein